MDEQSTRSECAEQIAARIASSKWGFVSTQDGVVKVCSQNNPSQAEWAVCGGVIVRGLYWPDSHHICLPLDSAGSQKIQELAAKVCEDIHSHFIRISGCPESFWILIKTTLSLAESCGSTVLVVLCNYILGDGYSARESAILGDPLDGN